MHRSDCVLLAFDSIFEAADDKLENVDQMSYFKGKEHVHNNSEKQKNEIRNIDIRHYISNDLIINWTP